MELATYDTQRRLSQTLNMHLFSLPQTMSRALSSVDNGHIEYEHGPGDLAVDRKPSIHEAEIVEHHDLFADGSERLTPAAHDNSNVYTSEPSFTNHLSGYYDDIEMLNLNQYHAIGQQNPQDFHSSIESYMADISPLSGVDAGTVHPPAVYDMDPTTTMHQNYQNVMSMNPAMPVHFNTQGADYTLYNQDDMYPQQYSPTDYYAPSTLGNEYNTASPSVDTPDLSLDQLSITESEPYAKLIWKCLREAPDNTLVLQDIYTWFKTNTGKVKNPDDPKELGWKNSIRHNLSMNKAFDKVTLPDKNGKQSGCVWRLSPEAARDGVQSTTRFRNKQPHKRTACPPSPHHDVRRKAGMAGGRQSKHNRARQTQKRYTAKMQNYSPNTPGVGQGLFVGQFGSLKIEGQGFGGLVGQGEGFMSVPSMHYSQAPGTRQQQQGSYFGPPRSTIDSFYMPAGIPTTPIRSMHPLIPHSPAPTSAAWTPTDSSSSYLDTPSSTSEFTPEFTPEPHMLGMSMGMGMSNAMALWDGPLEFEGNQDTMGQEFAFEADHLLGEGHGQGDEGEYEGGEGDFKGLED